MREAPAEVGFRRLRRGQTAQGSTTGIHSGQTEASCFLPAFLTGNLETPENVPRSELSCGTQIERSACREHKDGNMVNKCHKDK